MSYTIKKRLTKVNKGAAGSNKPEWLIVHFVGASGQAEANANYFEKVYRGASAHYFVDPKDIFQVVEDNRTAWHIGDGSRTKKGTHNGYVKKGGATNTNSIGIELCQDTSTGKDVWSWEFHPETVNKAEWLIRKLQKQYDIDDAHVIRHFDASTKKCPGNWADNDWAQWKAFKKRLEKDIVSKPTTGHDADEGKHHDESGMHLVEAGETLYGIAKTHGVTVEDMVKWNKLDDKNFIVPETKLYIKKPEAKSAPKQETKPAAKPKKTIDQLAQEVIDGKHGSGEAREKSLGSNYKAVQDRVNEMLSGKKPAAKPKKTIAQLAQEVIDGKHGTGEARKKSLGSNYNAVQKKVNEMTKSKSNQKSLDTLVKEVMAGKHGSGRERMISLGSRYAEVQKEINRRSR